ncbi:hypothetical protein L0152_26965 [bacterium]|nr:hypothetical protein [bacterium]
MTTNIIGIALKLQKVHQEMMPTPSPKEKTIAFCELDEESEELVGDRELCI